MAQQINVTSSMNADVTVESSNATQLVVTGSQNTVAVTIEPASNIAVTMSRVAIGTITAGITVQDEGSNIVNTNTINFTGSGVDVSNVGNVATVNILGLTGVTWSNVSDKNGNDGPTYISIGQNAGGNSIRNTIALGKFAGNLNQGISTIAIGINAGRSNQSANNIAIGNNAGYSNQAGNSVAIGSNAGVTSQSLYSTAVGALAGETTQNIGATSLGYAAGRTNQGSHSVALGMNAGYNSQKENAVGVGFSAGEQRQGNNAVAVGYLAGSNDQGTAAIAIGSFAGSNTQANNSILLNATNNVYDTTTANSFNVKPVRNANTANVMFYNNTTGEITYSLASNLVVGNSNYANVAGTAYSVAGANVSGTVANANYSVYSGTAGVANSVAVANVSGIGNIAVINLDGNVSNVLHGNGYWGPESGNLNANYANFAGTVITNSQPNITSVGILTGLVVDGNITPNSNITYNLGNNTNRFNDLYLSGNTIYIGPQEITANANGIGFTGNIDITNNVTALKFYAATGGDEYSGYGFVGAANSNTAMCLTATDEITFYNNAIETLSLYANNNSKFYANVQANLFIGDGGSLSNITGANVVGDVGGANHANVADSANSVAGANVSGEVSYAATANSVAVGNVSGIGNIATVNLDGNASNILYGNGSFAATPIISNVGNANYANFAGTVITNSQPNITSVGSLTSLTVSGNAIITGNLVVNGNTTSVNSNTVYIEDPVIQIGGGANGDPLTVNDGRDRGTVLDYYTTAPISAFMGWKNANGRFEFASNVTLANNVVTVNQLANISANYYIGNGSQLTGITATTGNANYANFAGQVVDATQSNITTVGNLVNLTVVGNASANSIQLNTGTGVTTANVGAMFWDAASNTVSLGMLNGVTQQIGLESYVLVKASATITDGQAVMFTGANGNHVTAAPADTTSVGFDPSYIIGIATQSIATNDFGYITVLGIVHGLNTNAFNLGDILWVDNATPGALTATRPSDPNYQIQVGAVTKKSAGDGHIQVRVTAFNSLNDLTNVNTTTPTTGQALVYNSANTTWVNGIPNIANIAYSVAGANVSGAVAFATTANSVAVANVSGIGNIATVNLTGSTSNVLYGNGVFAPVSGGSGGSSISNGTSNVNIATSGGNVTMGIGGTADVYTFSNTRITTTAAFQSQNSTPNALAFSVIQGGSGANGLTSTVTNQFSQLWNNASVKFETVRISVTDTASNANSILLTANTNNVTQFSINKSGNVNFAGIITGDGGGLSNIAPGNLSANVNFANTAGTVTTNAQPNITSVGQLSGLYIASNAFQMIQSGASTPGRFLVSHTPTGGLTANSYYSQFNQTWNNASATFTNFLVSVTDTASNANSRLFDAQTNSVSQFSINKSGNVVFAGVMTGDGGGLSNISATATSISNGTSNIRIASSGGNAIISVAGNANILTVTGTGINVAGTLNSTGNANVLNLGTAQILATANITTPQFISNVATGTAPLVVTSTTQVANLSVATAGLATYATTANAVAGANVSGAVSFATTANSVAVGNVSGIGNIATLNLDGNSSTVLYGNGVFAAISIPSSSSISNGNSNVNIATANGNVTIAAVGNTTMTITGTGANITGTANITGNANVGNIGANNAIFTTGNITTGNVGNLILTKYQETVIAGGNTGATTLTPNVATGTIFNYTLTGNITISALANAVAGSGATLILTQDASGNRTLTSTMKFLGGSKTLSTAANAIDIMSVFYDGTTYYATLGKGFA